MSDKSEELLHSVGGFHPVQAKPARNGTWVFLASRGDRDSPVRYLLRFLNPVLRRTAQTRVLLILDNLVHPGLLQYQASGRVESGVYSDSLWLVRPLRRTTLWSWKSRQQRSHADFANLAIQLSSAVEALHDRGILHLDIHPGNIFYDNSAWRLADFGIASLVGEEPCDSLATPYCAPEFRTGRGASTEADIYAMGALMAHCLAGFPEYGTVQDWLHVIPSVWRPGLDDATNPNPRRRPSARQLWEFFAGIIDREPGLSLAEADAILSSPGFLSTVIKNAEHRIDRYRSGSTYAEDASQEAILRLWSMVHDNPEFASRFKDERALVSYAATSAQRAVWRLASRTAFQVPYGIEEQDAITRYHFQTSQSPSAALDALGDLEDRLGSNSALICRLRMYGGSFEEIAERTHSESALDCFLTVVRLQRAYPELQKILPDLGRADARRYYSAWLADQIPETSVDILSMKLAGYTHPEIAEEMNLSVASVSSRLFRLRNSAPTLSLLTDPSTLWTDELSEAREILSSAGAGSLEGLDSPWTEWLQLRAATAFSQANDARDPDRATNAARQVIADLQIAMGVRARTLEEPSRPAVSMGDDGPATLLDRIDKSELVAFGFGEEAQVPLFQLESNGQVRDVVARVNETLGANADPYGAFYWWILPNASLGDRAPVELLENDDADEELTLLQLAQATVNPQ